MYIESLLNLELEQLEKEVIRQNKALEEKAIKLITLSKEISKIKLGAKNYIENLISKSHLLEMENSSIMQTKERINVYNKALEIKRLQVQAMEKGNYDKILNFVKNWYNKELDWHKTIKENTQTMKYEELKEFSKKSKISFKKIESIKNTSIEDISYKLLKELYKDYIYIIDSIEAKAGKIKDIKYITIGDNGDLNFLASGELRAVEVFTIGAGGYNIQRYHYRTLIKER